MKPDRVGETHDQPVAEVHAAQRRIERRERLVGDERVVAARAASRLSSDDLPTFV